MTIRAPASTTRVCGPTGSVPGAATATILPPAIPSSAGPTACGVTTQSPRMIRSIELSLGQAECRVARGGRQGAAARVPI